MDERRQRRQHVSGAVVISKRKAVQGVFNNRFSLTLEANDIFNKGNRDVRVMSKDVTIQRFSTISNRTFMLTLQYTFNATRDRYRGQGAGKNELNRF